MEKVNYLCMLEICSLNCEKDFLLSSLDEIDALILKKQEEAMSKSTAAPSKRSSTPVKQDNNKRQNMKHDNPPPETSDLPQPVSIIDVFSILLFLSRRNQPQ